MGYEWIGYLLMLSVTFGLMGWMLVTRLSASVKVLLLSAILLRVVGAFLRYYLLFAFYGGAGDAVTYFEYGAYYAERYADLDFGMWFDADEWRHGSFLGTHFLGLVSGLAVLLIGPTLRGEFLLFALLSLSGLLLIGFSIARSYPQVSGRRYLFWLLLWPSLWYWPASLGKDALVMLGLGAAVAGYVGRNGNIRWLLLAAGLALVFAIRSEVAALLAMTIALAQWLSFQGKWTPGRIAQGVALLAGCAVVVSWGTYFAGVQDVGVDGVQAYLTETSGNTAGSGGSGIEAVGTSPLDVPMAFITTLLRPFPWEANNVLALASSAEMLLLWSILLYRRRQVAAALRGWRQSRILRFALPFILMYSILLGMAVGNLGIIARQRIFIFPFLFLLIAWEPARAAVRQRRRSRRLVAG